MSLPMVAVVGRPNTGKSTLINRMASKPEAITHAMPGVTRDRKYIQLEWEGKDFTIIDTGGIEFAKDQTLTVSIKQQAEIAVEEAEVIIFLVDYKEGPQPDDEEIALYLKKQNKKVFLTINKVDSAEKLAVASAEFYKLGLGEPFAISALHGLGIADLLDDVAAGLPDAVRVDVDSVAVAIVGRPNAGKSSITNKLLGFERTIVSEIPGTTRDAVDSLVEVEGDKWTFIDTAGIKRKKGEDLDYYGLVRALRSIDRASICLLVIDSSEGVTEQDQKLAEMILSRGSACIIVLNKWDLMDEQSIERLKSQTMRKLRFIDYSPILATSALKGSGIDKIFPMLKTLSESYFKRIATSQLNRLVQELPVGSLPVKKEVKIKYATQAATGPPVFTFFVNDPVAAKKIRRYVENKIRETFTFLGTPVIIKFKKK